MIKNETARNIGNPDKKEWATALYIRTCLECEEKEENSNIVMQKEALQTFLTKNLEFKIFDIYIDDGYTGLNFYRPEFLRMIDDVSDKRINCIIVSDISRIGKRIDLVESYIFNVFPKNNVRFISLKDKFDTQNLFEKDIQIKNSFNLILENDLNV